MVAAAVIGGAALSAGASYMGSKSQSNAANNAADMQQAQYQQTRSDLMPYQQFGSANMQNYQNALNNPTLNQQFSFTPGDLTQTPGYQFNYDQGMRAVNNSAAARGLGLSGAQLKGASSFASGLAENTYNDAYNRALSTFNTNYQNAANRVSQYGNAVGMGQNAASQTGTFGLQSANNAGNYITSAGNANAAGMVGAANAVNSGINNYLGYNALNSAMGSNGMYGSSSNMDNYLTTQSLY
jgi:hypothetical protein